MKNKILMFGVLVVLLGYSSCENEDVIKDEQIKDELFQLSNKSNFDYYNEARLLADKIDFETFDLTDLNLQILLSNLKLDNKEIVTTDFVQNILDEGEYVKEFGLESFYRKYNLSDFTINYLLEINNSDISGLVNERQFSSLPVNEKLMLEKAIEINENLLNNSHNNSIYKAKNGEYWAMYGSVGMMLGTIIAPGPGTAVGYLIGSVIGIIVDKTK